MAQVAITLLRRVGKLCSRFRGHRRRYPFQVGNASRVEDMTEDTEPATQTQPSHAPSIERIPYMGLVPLTALQASRLPLYDVFSPGFGLAATTPIRRGHVVVGAVDGSALHNQ